ncbi:MAG: hypothetical protein LUG60_04655 [Erysipelotrichaceae bacterium]|nr:hypothetical protein [Erysipelotrichaceae bacterium]
MKYTQKQIEYVIETLMTSPYHSSIMSYMTPDQQKEYAVDYANNVIKNIPLYSDSLLKQMMNIDSGDPRTLHIVKTIIEDITNISVTSLVKLDKELVRNSDESKSAILDNHFLVNDYLNIDIEGQRSIDDAQLLAKNLFYDAAMFFNYNRKGENDVSKYHKAILICIYEDIYHGEYGEGIIEDLNDFIKRYEPMSQKYGPDKNNKLYIYIVELGKIKNIVEKKGIDNMDRIESIGYAFKYAHELNSEIQKNIDKLYDKEPVVKDMIDMRDEYKESPSYHLRAIKEYIDHVIDIGEGERKQIEVERLDYYQRVLKRFKMNYCEDPEFLKDLSLEAYKYIDDLIFENAFYDEIREYVDSIS